MEHTLASVKRPRQTSRCASAMAHLSLSSFSQRATRGLFSRCFVQSNLFQESEPLLTWKCCDCFLQDFSVLRLPDGLSCNNELLLRWHVWANGTLGACDREAVAGIPALQQRFWLHSQAGPTRAVMSQRQPVLCALTVELDRLMGFSTSQRDHFPQASCARHTKQPNAQRPLDPLGLSKPRVRGPIVREARGPCPLLAPSFKELLVVC